MQILYYFHLSFLWKYIARTRANMKKIRGLKTFQQYRMFQTCAQIAKHSAISLNRIRYFEIQKNRTEILMFCRASVTEFLAKIRDHVGAKVRVQLRFSVSPKVGSGKKNGPDPLHRLFEIKC